MKTIIQLTKIQFQFALGNSALVGRQEKKKKKKTTNKASALSIVSYALFMFLSFIYSSMLAESYEKMGIIDFLPIMWMIFSSILILMTSIYQVKGLIVQFKDYDIVMSLPIKTSHIVASRIVVLYLMDLVQAMVFILPANIVYAITIGAGMKFYINSIVLLLFVPMLPAILSTIVGIILAVITSRFRKNNVLQIIFTGMWTLVVMVACFSVSSSNTSPEMIADFSKSLIHTTNRVYPLIKIYEKALLQSELVSIAIFILVSVAAFGLFSIVVGRKFKQINTYVDSLKVKSNFRMKELHASSLRRALIKKEWSRYIASSNYVLNTAMFGALATILSIGLLIFGQDKVVQIKSIEGMEDVITLILPYAMTFMFSLTSTTVSSISIEGKNLWVIKSLPVKAMDVFISKVSVNLFITLPFIFINSVVYNLLIDMTLFERIMTMVIPSISVICYSFFGLYLNVKMPKFDWKSEIAIIKQGAPVVIFMLVGMVVTGGTLLLVATVFEKYQAIYAVIYCIIFSGLTIMFYQYFKKNAEKLLLEMN